MTVFQDVLNLISALFGGDLWSLRSALQDGSAAWVLGTIVTAVGGIIIAFIYNRVKVIERLLEPTIMVVAYLLIAAIISVSVYQRFVLNVQVPWSSTIPPFLFLLLTWAGCAYNVRLRTHLSFQEFRTAMPRPLQFACLTLDMLLWFLFSVVVVVTAFKVTVNSAANFQLVLGTDDVQQWWFLATVPFSFLLVAGRAFENYFEDVGNYRAGRPLLQQAVIGNG